MFIPSNEFCALCDTCGYKYERAGGNLSLFDNVGTFRKSLGQVNMKSRWNDSGNWILDPITLTLECCYCSKARVANPNESHPYKLSDHINRLEREIKYLKEKIKIPPIQILKNENSTLTVKTTNTTDFSLIIESDNVIQNQEDLFGFSEVSEVNKDTNVFNLDLKSLASLSTLIAKVTIYSVKVNKLKELKEKHNIKEDSLCVKLED